MENHSEILGLALSMHSDEFCFALKVVSLVNLSLSEMRIAVLSFCRMLGEILHSYKRVSGKLRPKTEDLRPEN